MAENKRSGNGEESMLTEFDLMYMGRSYARLQLYREALEKWGLTRKNHVLDAGCGYGAWTYALSKLNGFVVGVEKDERKAGLAIDVVEENAGNTEIYNCDIEHMHNQSYADEHFDGILCFHTIYYTQNWQQTLESLASLMTPGGIMYINIATKACFLYMAQSIDETTKKMGIDALNNERRKAKGIEYSTENGIPIDQMKFEEELNKLDLATLWKGSDEVARHPGVIGYVVRKCTHNDM
jgi:2-polyprenyl-3-methyl-5-hydroxy-6-metoxy-1,4-benzoquinol methylase